jgi:predicted RNA-binding Zn-ribbon protein involved in translation (DUF1610 family)
VNIAARLKRIEAVLFTGGCPECGAGGGDDEEPTFRWVPPEEADTPCPNCGVVPRVIRMRPVRLTDTAVT